MTMLHDCIQDLMLDLQAIERYFNQAKDGREFNFVIDIQPFTENVDTHLNQLKDYESEIKDIHLMNQLKLDYLIKHMRELSVECFFDKTSKKMFLDKFKAVQHDLHLMERKS